MQSAIWNFLVSPPAVIAGIVLLLGLLGYVIAFTRIGARVITDFIKRYRGSDLPNLSAELSLVFPQSASTGLSIQLTINRDRGTDFVYPEIEVKSSEDLSIVLNKAQIGTLEAHSVSYIVGVIEYAELSNLDDESFVSVEVDCRVYCTRLICNTPVLHLRTAVSQLELQAMTHLRSAMRNDPLLAPAADESFEKFIQDFRNCCVCREDEEIPDNVFEFLFWYRQLNRK